MTPFAGTRGVTTHPGSACSLAFGTYDRHAVACPLHAAACGSTHCHVHSSAGAGTACSVRRHAAWHFASLRWFWFRCCPSDAVQAVTCDGTQSETEHALHGDMTKRHPRSSRWLTVLHELIDTGEITRHGLQACEGMPAAALYGMLDAMQCCSLRNALLEGISSPLRLVRQASSTSAADDLKPGRVVGAAKTTVKTAAARRLLSKASKPVRG